MSNQRPRIVLVGAGGYGRLYVEAMAQRDYGADLAAICDIDPHLADRIPIIREQSIPIYPSLEAFFANDTADLAVLVSPGAFPHRYGAALSGAWAERSVREAPLPDYPGGRDNGAQPPKKPGGSSPSATRSTTVATCWL